MRSYVAITTELEFYLNDIPKHITHDGNAHKRRTSVKRSAKLPRCVTAAVCHATLRVVFEPNPLDPRFHHYTLKQFAL